jgi:hypothetical protein
MPNIFTSSQQLQHLQIHGFPINKKLSDFRAAVERAKSPGLINQEQIDILSLTSANYVTSSSSHISQLRSPQE